MAGVGWVGGDEGAEAYLCNTMPVGKHGDIDNAMSKDMLMASVVYSHSGLQHSHIGLQQCGVGYNFSRSFRVSKGGTILKTDHRFQHAFHSKAAIQDSITVGYEKKQRASEQTLRSCVSSAPQDDISRMSRSSSKRMLRRQSCRAASTHILKQHRSEATQIRSHKRHRPLHRPLHGHTSCGRTGKPHKS
jgi:hypothetical protein